MDLSKSASGRSLWAGAATTDLTPHENMFLFGYPNVQRISTGVHDRLESAALYLRAGSESVLIIANDLIFVSKETAQEVRRRISIETGMPASAIAISATHTHSGPVTVNYLNDRDEKIVPPADPRYLQWVVSCMVEAGCTAVLNAVPAEAGLETVRVEGVGTNRHDPNGPADPEVPVLLVRSKSNGAALACMVIYAMHPTVMHEDSTLISGDFPYFARRYLRQQGGLSADCTILYHNGAAGNQSPRHVTRANTFAEAQRLGEILGASIASVFSRIKFTDDLPIKSANELLTLEVRPLPTEAGAEKAERAARARFDALIAENADRRAIRSAECDWFGSLKTVVFAQAATDGHWAAAIQRCMPAEIQLITLGPWKFVFWQGEIFVEYALQLKAQSPNTFVVTLANGELQGYIVTSEAVEQKVYEANNAMFSPSNGQRMVTSTLALLRQIG